MLSLIKRDDLTKKELLEIKNKIAKFKKGERLKE